MNKFEIETVFEPSYFNEEIGEEMYGLKCPYCEFLVVSEGIQPCKHVACIACDEGVEFVHPDFTLGKELCNDFDSAYKGFTIAVTLYFSEKYNEGKVYHLEDLHIDGFVGFFK